ncbi:MAG: VanZ family protein [Gemmataceae bacterium]
MIPFDLKFIASKIAHVGGYTFLTLLAAWLPLSRKGFWITVALLAAHGAVSEILQHVLGWGRTGKATDVLIDCFGISLGLLALWSARRKKEKGKRKTEDTNQPFSSFFFFPFSFFLLASSRFLA